MGTGGHTAIGVDLGGTKIAAGVVGSDYRLLSYEVRPTEAFRPRENVLANIRQTIVASLHAIDLDVSDLGFVGVGVPTALADDGNAMVASENLPTLGDFALRSYLEQELGCDVLLENDAKCFASGEAVAGAGNGAANLVGLTLGTGIGVGLVLNGALFRGRRGRAGEIWDQPMPAGTILEDGISGRRLAEQVGCDDAYTVVCRARGGDAGAKRAIDEYGRNVGWLVSIIGRLIDPDLFVLGGSLSNAMDLFEGTIAECTGSQWPVVVSELKDKAAILGAARLPRTGDLY